MAARFWVGGSGTWDATTTTNWATGSGLAGGASAPTAADAVTFDAASGAGTCTLSGIPLCASLTATATSVTTFTGTGTLACSGNFALKASMTVSGWTGTITLNGTGAQTVTINGNTMACAITVDSNAGSYTLQDALNMTGKTLTLTRGTLNTNGKTVTINTLSSNNGNTRTLTLGASTINFDTNNSSMLLLGNNITLNSNTSSIVATNNFSFTLNTGLTFNNFTGTVGTSFSINLTSGSVTFANFSVSTGAGTTASCIFPSGSTVTVTSTFTANGNNATTDRIIVRTNSMGSPVTLSAAVVSASNADFRDITATGASSWSLAAITGNSGDCGGNTGITFTTPSTQTWSGTSGGNWSANAWTSHVPLSQDSVVINAAFTAGQTVTGNVPRLGKDINWTGATGTPAFNANVSTSIFGSLTLISGMTIGSSVASLTFSGRSSHTITSAGKTWQKDIVIDCGGGTYTLSDDFSNSSGTVLFEIDSGTFDANDFNVSCSRMFSQSLTTRTITMGNGTWTITNTSGGWNAIPQGAMTLNAEGSTIKFTGALVGAATFVGGGLTYYKVWNATTNAFAFQISDSNTFYELKSDAGRTIQFTDATTQTLTNFNCNGTSGNLTTIDSIATATHAIVKSGSGFVEGQYLNIQHSVVTPAGIWFAGANSTNNQATVTAGSGWIFENAPPTLGVLNKKVKTLRPRPFAPGLAR